MTDPSPSPVSRRWHDGRAPQGPPNSGRVARVRLFALAAVGMALAGSIAGLFSWLRPAPRPILVTLWVSGYESPLVPPLRQARMDLLALERGRYFSRTIGNYAASQDRNDLMERLEALRGLAADESVVVYVCAYARGLGDAGLFLWPADADLDEPSTWLSLREVLRSLRDCEAARKLLILDIVHPLADPRRGVLIDDVADRIPEDLQAVPDPRRLVLTSCSPGQVALVSEDLGRSVFGYYVEEGLRGRTTLGRLHGLVHAEGLGSFVRDRVSRWARLNRGTQQEPALLGSGKDFPLLALRHGQPRPPLRIPAVPSYPAWLLEGWKYRDRWWGEDALQTAPRVVRQWEALLLRDEERWRAGVSEEAVRRDLAFRLPNFQHRLRLAQQVPQPQPRSLGLAESLGWRPDGAVAGMVRELLAKRAEQLRSAKPGQAEAAVAPLVADFAKKTSATPDRDLAWAVFDAAADDNDPRPETIRFLDGLLESRQPQPLFVESLFLRRLAQLAEEQALEGSPSLPASAWPVDTVRRALHVVRVGELSAGRPEPLGWVRGMLDTAAQERHDGEVFLRARGFVPPVAADASFKRAEDHYESIQTYRQRIQDARHQLDRALAFLPAYLPNLDLVPDREGSWHAAVLEAERVSRALIPSSAEDLGPQVDDLGRQGDGLRLRMDDLLAPLGPEAVAELIKDCTREDAGPDVCRRVEALLATPLLEANDRAALWKAGRSLSHRLLEQTYQLDQRPGSQEPTGTGPSLGATVDPRRRATRLARTSIDLLRLGGLDPADIRQLDGALSRASASRADAPLWPSLAGDLREAWSVKLPDQLLGSKDLETRDHLGRIFPPSEPSSLLDDPSTDPSFLLRVRESKALWAWLADRYRYEGLDFGGSSLYALASRDCQELAEKMPPGVELRLAVEGGSPALTLERPSALSTVRVELLTAPTRGSTVEVELVGVDADWLRVIPASAESIERRLGPRGQAVSSAFTLPASASGTWSLPLMIELQPGAGPSGPSPPPGFLVRARVDGRPFSAEVPVSLRSVSDRLLVLLSADPKGPSDPRSSLRLRPIADRQPFYLYVQNPTDRPRTIGLEVAAGGVPVPNGVVKLTVGARGTVKADFGESVPKPGEPLPGLRGPLQVRLRDADNPGASSQTFEVGVQLASAREYVRVAEARFEPADPAGGGKNRLSVALEALPSFAGPPAVAGLVLPPDRIPGLLSAGKGTFRASVAADGSKQVLFAEDVRLDASAEREGTFYVTIDQYERAFIFRTSFDREGAAVLPLEVGRPALRLQAARIARTDPSLTVTTEADNPPSGSTLELSLGREVSGSFISDVTRTFPGARDERLGFHAGGPGGALLFEASIKDWTVPLEIGGITGRRELRARLLDREGLPIALASQAVVIDVSPPSRAEFVDLPRKARQGSLLSVKAFGVPPESGITGATFFVGRPVDDKVPPGAPTATGGPLDPDQTIWTAQLLLPSGKIGPTDVSVQFLSGAGAGRFATATIDLLETDPPVLGTIRGTVLEGPRPQPGLDVVLSIEKGGEKERTKTARNGEFAFRGVPPGQYKVTSVKPSSRTHRDASVTVDAKGNTVPAAVTLELLRVK